jgi:hypothetical protein
MNLMLGYLTDAVVADHTSIIHSGLELCTGHRSYILGMENFLSANGGGTFDPLPVWNSANPIPPEFNVVKNPGPLRPPLVNLNPTVPKPSQFEHPADCEYGDPAWSGNDIDGRHGSVHVAIGGTMDILAQASAAPIFWCWHAFVDHIYWDWQRCTVPCPDVTGCTLERYEPRHGGSHHEPGTDIASPEFLHPRPDYSYLRRGPRVIAQAPIRR